MSTLAAQNLVKKILDEYLVPELLELISEFIYELPILEIARGEHRITILSDDSYASQSSDFNYMEIFRYDKNKHEYIFTQKIPLSRTDISSLVGIGEDTIITNIGSMLVIYNIRQMTKQIIRKETIHDAEYAADIFRIHKLDENYFITEHTDCSAVLLEKSKSGICKRIKTLEKNLLAVDVIKTKDNTRLYYTYCKWLVSEKMYENVASLICHANYVIETRNGDIIYSYNNKFLYEKRKPRFITEINKGLIISTFIELSDGSLAYGTDNGILGIYNFTTNKHMQTPECKDRVRKIIELNDGSLVIDYTGHIKFRDKNLVLQEKILLYGELISKLKNGGIYVRGLGGCIYA